MRLTKTIAVIIINVNKNSRVVAEACSLHCFLLKTWCMLIVVKRGISVLHEMARIMRLRFS